MHTKAIILHMHIIDSRSLFIVGQVYYRTSLFLEAGERARSLSRGVNGFLHEVINIFFPARQNQLSFLVIVMFRIREQAQSCAFDELENMAYVPCRKMIVWTIVWCPHRFTHEKTHCLFEPELSIF